MELNKLVIGMAKSFDDTIKGMVKIFDFGGAIANINKLSPLGKEYKVASLMVELSVKNKISENQIDKIIKSTYEDETTNELILNLKQQFTK